MEIISILLIIIICSLPTLHSIYIIFSHSNGKYRGINVITRVSLFMLIIRNPWHRQRNNQRELNLNGYLSFSILGLICIYNNLHNYFITLCYACYSFPSFCQSFCAERKVKQSKKCKRIKLKDTDENFFSLK